jgi:hypothetical protein
MRTTRSIWREESKVARFIHARRLAHTRTHAGHVQPEDQDVIDRLQAFNSVLPPIVFRPLSFATAALAFLVFAAFLRRSESCRTCKMARHIALTRCMDSCMRSFTIDETDAMSPCLQLWLSPSLPLICPHAYTHSTIHLDPDGGDRGPGTHGPLRSEPELGGIHPHCCRHIHILTCGSPPPAPVLSLLQRLDTETNFSVSFHHFVAPTHLVSPIYSLTAFHSLSAPPSHSLHRLFLLFPAPSSRRRVPQVEAYLKRLLSGLSVLSAGRLFPTVSQLPPLPRALFMPVLLLCESASTRGRGVLFHERF